jgi:hypothetical protein
MTSEPARCHRCNRPLPWAGSGQGSGASCLGCLMPACYRCGRPGQVPIRPHRLAMCESCYLGELAVTVDTGELVPA